MDDCSFLYYQHSGTLRRVERKTFRDSFEILFNRAMLTRVSRRIRAKNTYVRIVRRAKREVQSSRVPAIPLLDVRAENVLFAHNPTRLTDVVVTV